MEAWKDIKGYEGRYQISDLGRIKSLEKRVKVGHGAFRIAKESILKVNIENGYMRISLWDMDNSKQHRFLIHRLVAETFIPNPENKPTVNHINGNKSDNRIENLEWCTQSENNVHAIKTGLRIFLNAKSTLTKLSESDIHKIKSLLNEGVSQKKIADKYNVTRATIKNIRQNKTWKQVA